MLGAHVQAFDTSERWVHLGERSLAHNELQVSGGSVPASTHLCRCGDK